MQVEKMGVGDNVIAKLGKATSKAWSRVLGEKVRPRGNVHAVLRGPDGEIKYEEWGHNLLTDHGDEWLASRAYDDAVNIVTGMRLGTGATAAAKNGAGAAIVTYISGSNEALDAAATDATKGAGAGWRTTFICTWIAGDVTNSAIAEVVLSDETPFTDVAGVAGNTVARYVFGATIDKQAGDSLEVTWQVDILGA
jgi:hypothetical protein